MQIPITNSLSLLVFVPMSRRLTQNPSLSGPNTLIKFVWLSIQTSVPHPQDLRAWISTRSFTQVPLTNLTITFTTRDFLPYSQPVWPWHSRQESNNSAHSIGSLRQQPHRPRFRFLSSSLLPHKFPWVNLFIFSVIILGSFSVFTQPSTAPHILRAWTAQHSTVPVSQLTGFSVCQ